MAQHVSRNSLSEFCHEDGSFRARPHNAHFAFEDVEELWNFVKRSFTKPFANHRGTRVVFFSPDGAGFVFGIVHPTSALEPANSTILKKKTNNFMKIFLSPPKVVAEFSAACFFLVYAVEYVYTPTPDSGFKQN
jgi:aryl-alcohol dehydrogenase-like predicted oxidoreductase